MKKYFILAISGFFLFSSCMNQSPPEIESSQAVVDSSLTMPEGFTAYEVINKTGRGRHLVVNDNGDIYLALRRPNNGGGIVALRDTNNDSRADLVKYFGDYAGTGIDIRDGYLYFGSDQEIVRYKMREGELLPENDAEIIATGFPEQNQHATKSFAFDNDGNLYVNVGAPSNACMERTRTKGSPGMDPCPQLDRQAGIWKFKADAQNQDQVNDGIRYATGIRNSVALDWNDKSGFLYVVQHGRDQLEQFFPDLYTEKEGAQLPAEEFLLLEEGSDFGWPYCYYDQIQNKRVLAPEYGGDGNETGRCAEKEDPILAFPGHIAPNDLLFYTGNQFPDRYKNGAFIAFHGSWNRSPFEQEGFYVVFVPFDGKYPAGEWEIFANGFDGDKKVMSPADAEYRPTGLAQGPDGALYVSDSNEGKVWKIIYTGGN